MLHIRELAPADPAVIAAAFAGQGWRKPVEQYERYLAECAQRTRTVLVALSDAAFAGGAFAGGAFAGYVTILWQSTYPPFAAARIPEIADFNVLIAHRRRGIGTALMDEAERRIAARSDTAGIAVGLTADYGAAQVLYLKRGYVLDGRGLYQRGRWLQWGDEVAVDDDLILHLTKALRAGERKLFHYNQV